MLEVRCDLDMETAPSFERVLVEELEDGCRVLVVDLSECDFLGSSGLTALAEGKHRAESTNARMALAGTSRMVGTALQITGMDALFDSYPSAGEAVAALSQGS